jgi:hypothetical protein
VNRTNQLKTAKPNKGPPGRVLVFVLYFPLSLAVSAKKKKAFCIALLFTAGWGWLATSLTWQATTSGNSLQSVWVEGILLFMHVLPLFTVFVCFFARLGVGCYFHYYYN